MKKKTKGRVATSKRTMFQYKNWRIRKADPSNLVIEHLKAIKNPDTGEVREEWQFGGYYGKFTSAIESLGDKIGFNADTLEDAVSEIRELRKAIEGIMKGRP